MCKKKRNKNSALYHDVIITSCPIQMFLIQIYHMNCDSIPNKIGKTANDNLLRIIITFCQM